MKTEQVAIALCPKCKKEPTFFSWPDAEFPVLFVALCECNRAMNAIGSALNRYSYCKKDKPIKRKASLSAAIRKWNTTVQHILKARKSSNGIEYATCKYCKRDDLMWAKRPYKSAWNGKAFDFILYEQSLIPSPTGIAIGGLTINKIKFKIHNCLSRKNIVSITYTKD